MAKAQLGLLHLGVTWENLRFQRDCTNSSSAKVKKTRPTPKNSVQGSFLGSNRYAWAVIFEAFLLQIKISESGFLIVILPLLTRQVEHHGWFVLGIEPLVKNQWWKRSRIFNVNICVCNEIWILTNDSLSNLLANFSNLNSEEDFWVSIFQKGKGGNAEAHDVWKSQKKSHFSTLRVFKNRCLRSNNVSD